jgi:Ran GTPase-activating protein (RanGAP) involved in mRNA processing and transport
MCVLQGGNELCRINVDRRKLVSELKVSIEAEAGSVTLLINPKSGVELQDHMMLEDVGMPSEQALVAGVMELCAQTLKKIIVADELEIAPGEVTDSELAALCDRIRDDPTDMLVLSGCHRVTDISCLVLLPTISHLDISSCSLGAQVCFQLAGVIKDMGALTSLHVGRNGIPQKEMREIIAIAMRMDSMKILCEIPFKDKTLTELDISGKNLGMEGALVVTEYLDGNGALSSVNLLQNDIDVAQAEDLVSILKEHPTLKSLCGNKGDETELDMSGKMSGAGDATMLAGEVVDNEAMTRLNLSNNDIGGEDGEPGVHALADMLRSNTTLKELNISSNNLDEECAQILAPAIGDNRAIENLHVGSNGIPEKEMCEIMAIVMSKESMQILCEVPFKDKTITELDLSGKDLGTEGALVVAEYLDGNGALTSLNLSSNNLKAEGGKIVAEAIKVTNNAMGVVLVPVSCPSDHWLNCCCLLLSTG